MVFIFWCLSATNLCAVQQLHQWFPNGFRGRGPRLRDVDPTSLDCSFSNGFYFLVFICYKFMCCATITSMVSKWFPWARPTAFIYDPTGLGFISIGPTSKFWLGLNMEFILFSLRCQKNRCVLSGIRCTQRKVA